MVSTRASSRRSSRKRSSSHGSSNQAKSQASQFDKDGNYIPPHLRHRPSESTSSTPVSKLRGRRLAPDLNLHPDLGTIDRSISYIKRVNDGEIEIDNGTRAENLIRNMLCYLKVPAGTWECLAMLTKSPEALGHVMNALSFNTYDSRWLNNYVCQFFLFVLGPYRYTTESGAQVEFDEMVERIILTIVEVHSRLLYSLADAARKDLLTPVSLEAFAWFLKEYLTFCQTPAPYTMDMLQDDALLDRFINSSVTELRLIGEKLKFWVDCGGLVRESDEVEGPLPGSRHDNDYDDFRRIQTLPTPLEINAIEPPFLVTPMKALSYEGKQRHAAYLDSQYRLLRQEMVYKIQQDYAELLTGTKIENEAVGPIAKTVFENLGWGGLDTDATLHRRRFGLRLILRDGFEKYIEHNPETYYQRVQEDKEFPYRDGSLGCILLDDEIIGFGIVRRDEESLKEEPPRIIVTLEKHDIENVLITVRLAMRTKPLDEISLRLIRADTAYYAHEPILKRLQQMKEIPLGQHLIFHKKGDRIPETSFAPRQAIRSLDRSGKLKDLLKKISYEVDIDSSQKSAILSGLRNKLTLIQGPPGTGKTLVGTVIAKTLLEHTKEKILLITYQNHACDEFLKTLLSMGVDRMDIVRLGSTITKEVRDLGIHDSGNSRSLGSIADYIIHKNRETYECIHVSMMRDYRKLFEQDISPVVLCEIAKGYNEPQPEEPMDLFGYRSAFTVTDEWKKYLESMDEKMVVPKDWELFVEWAEGNPLPSSLGDYITERGREIWELPLEDRETLRSWFEEAAIYDGVYQISHMGGIFNKIVEEKDKWKGTRTRDILRDKRLIAATTNGAATNLLSINAAAPKILIVEEAAQIMEPHILTALNDQVEQIIMIGDHKQLRPRIECQDLKQDAGYGFNLDVSMFERLIDMGVPHITLNVQHRARPEIADIIRTLIYPTLKDAPNVLGFEGIRGLQMNMLWMHHANPESELKQVVKTSKDKLKKNSKVNHWEADMVISIIRYLTAQGYRTDRIAVISPYLAQVALIAQKMSEKGKFDAIIAAAEYHELVRVGHLKARDVKGLKQLVEVSTVDQFQGTDRDIIIVSTVRSNDECRIGFLRDPQRLNVMLSRARQGLIVIGNLATLCSRPDRNGRNWLDVMQVFAKGGRILDGLPIICERHKDQRYICKSAQQLDYMTPEGRCRLPCDGILRCGHQCVYFCHRIEDHSRMDCERIVTKNCEYGHQWEDKCATKDGSKCKKCADHQTHFQRLKAEDEARLQQEIHERLADEERRKKKIEAAEAAKTAVPRIPRMMPYDGSNPKDYHKKNREMYEESLRKKAAVAKLAAEKTLAEMADGVKAESEKANGLNIESNIPTGSIQVLSGVAQQTSNSSNVTPREPSFLETSNPQPPPDKIVTETANPNSHSLPSSPPLLQQQGDLPSSHFALPSEGIPQDQETRVEEVSESSIRKYSHTIADSSVIVEEPSSIIEGTSQVEEITASFEALPNSASETSIISIENILPQPFNTSNTNKPATPVKLRPQATIAKSPQANSEPKALHASLKPIMEAKSIPPFPSASRDEWENHKKLSRDTNAHLDNIMAMIGMEHVKQQVLGIKSKVETVRRQGIDLTDERFHIALLGNPGTGKTTFARLYAKFLRSEGVIESSAYVEITGAKLASEGVAGIQELFTELLQAKGGTLFIDEAYQLVTSGMMMEGRQVLDVLLTEMEKHLGKIIIIFSGYNKEMEKFFEHNPGLHSRVPYQVQFEDFTNEELLYLLQDVLKKKFKGKMKIEGGYNGLYLQIVSKRLGRTRGLRGCGNARSVQNNVAKILERQAARLTRERKAGKKPDDFLLTMDDIIGPAPTKAVMESPAWKELHQLIGLKAVKESVGVLLKRMENNYRRELAGEKPIDISLNRVLLGSPGTGKTSVAKIYGKILAQLGLLSSGEVIMKTPSDFVGRALGESEANTKAILNTARGKVLIIDEAYMLTPKLNGGDDPFKAAVVDTIVSEVHNVPGNDQCVLLLGYQGELEKMFRASNPGFSRRFPIADGFLFQDFTDAELSKILDLKLRLAELKASPEAREVAIKAINHRRQKPNFGNAGEVENLLNVAKERMLKRQIESTEEDINLELLPTDFDPDHDRASRADGNLHELFKDLIGVETVMEKFEEYQATARIMRGRSIDPREHIPMLFIFRGPPGTGKTTTAKKMGQIFYNMGLLASNEVVDCGATDLIAQYLGQTAHRTRSKLESALGKVLFIDEAYRLQDNQYGQEASNELVDAVTKPQFMGKLVIILAGYDEGIDRLLAVNVGLASRFSEVIDFPHIPPPIALDILRAALEKQKVSIPSLDTKGPEYYELLEYMEEISRTDQYGHARDAENLAKAMISKALRAVKGLDDSVVVTHEMAIKAMTDMLKTRKGRDYKIVREAFKFSMPLISPPAEHQQVGPIAAPKVNINIQPVADQVKVQETGQPGDSASKDTSEPRDSSRHLNDEAQIVNLDEPTPQSIATEDAEIDEQKRATLRQKWHHEIAGSTAETPATADPSESAFESDAEYLKHLENLIEESQIRSTEISESYERDEQELERLLEEEAVHQARLAGGVSDTVEDRINLQKLEMMGRCPKNYSWRRASGGYHCLGGEHFVSMEDIRTFQVPERPGRW
ncbi:hypothetical protein ABW19_dt0200627 [Dactylella cylindrospora]|nr:hypothetical protein ABW19_dt0200627 [Dactylella cylindrospora]